MIQETNIYDLVKLSEAYLTKGEGEIASMYARFFAEEIRFREGKGKKPKHHKSEKGLYDFHFNWKSGGYNSVLATSREEALQEAKNKFSDKFIVDPDTLRVLTGLEAEAHWKQNFFD